MRIHIHDDRIGQPIRLTKQLWTNCFPLEDALSRACNVSFGETAEELRAVLPDVQMLVCTGVPPQPPLQAAPHLRQIFCTFSGIDAMMPLDWLPPTIELINNSGVHEAKAGEYAIMSMLMLVNNIPAYACDQRMHIWKRKPGSTLRGRRVTIVGLGALGSGAAKWAKQFGMHVIGVRTRPTLHPDCHEVHGVDQLDALLPASEFLLLACPLTTETQNILSRARIGQLPADGFVVNIGRGGLLDQDALCDALVSGNLGGAILDVFTPEPVAAGHRLWTTPNLLMTPHVSCDDFKTYLAQSLAILRTNLIALMAGQPAPNRVDRDLGY